MELIPGYVKLSDLCDYDLDSRIIDRIDKFSEMCNMVHFKQSSVRGKEVKTISGKLFDESNYEGSERSNEPDFFINIRNDVDERNEKCHLLKGYYAGLSFVYRNYFKEYENGKNLPFSLVLDVYCEGKDEYLLVIQSTKDNELKFSVTKKFFRKGSIDVDTFNFYYTTDDFDDAFRISSLFIFNPEYTFTTYKNIYCNKLPKRVDFNKDELECVILYKKSFGELSDGQIKKIK